MPALLREPQHERCAFERYVDGLTSPYHESGPSTVSFPRGIWPCLQQPRIFVYIRNGKQRTRENIPSGTPFFLRVTIIDVDMIITRILSSGNEYSKCYSTLFETNRKTEGFHQFSRLDDKCLVDCTLPEQTWNSVTHSGRRPLT